MKNNKIPCPECLGKGFHYEGFDEAEFCSRCQGEGLVSDNSKKVTLTETNAKEVVNE